jgi:hypothetical protein
LFDETSGPEIVHYGDILGVNQGVKNLQKRVDSPEGGDFLQLYGEVVLRIKKVSGTRKAQVPALLQHALNGKRVLDRFGCKKDGPTGQKRVGRRKDFQEAILSFL